MVGRGQEYHFKSLAQMNNEIKKKKEQGYEVVHIYAKRPGKNNLLEASPLSSGYVTQPGTLFVVEFRRIKRQSSKQRFHLFGG